MEDERAIGRKRPPGVPAALLAALLFGLTTPLAKRWLAGLPPALAAGLLYAGSGIGLAILRAVFPRRGAAGIARADLPRLAGAVVSGGVIAPVLCLQALHDASASSRSPLLTLGGAFTVPLAWFVFREHFDRRIALGMLSILAGGVALSWEGGGAALGPSLFAAAACLGWAIDNNLTQRISAGDPVTIAAVKGVVAGAVNVTAALALGASLPPARIVTIALVVGFTGYGVSLS